MLEADRVNVVYGDAQALWDVSLTVGEGEIVTVLGANGAGKTTLIHALAGVVPVRSGMVRFNGDDLTRRPAHEICPRGIALVPEGRRLFPQMTVWENLVMGSYARIARPHRRETEAWVYDIFPRLHERRRQLAGTLSGGEQQMVAIGRALMARPRLLLLDEPSQGLAPVVVDTIFEVMRQIHQAGVALLLVEQHVTRALALAGRGYVLEDGRIVLAGAAGQLTQHPLVASAYLGVTAGPQAGA
jgi:branched-chain amino acid transport system ATP-binding protein